MCTDTLWWPDFRHLRAAAYTHIHTGGLEKVKWVITLSSFLLVCFVPFHFGHDQNTIGINEYTLHTSISTYGPNENNVSPAHQIASGPRGWCSRMIQLLYFPFTLPSTVNISTMWPSQWRPPRKSFQLIVSQVGLNINWFLLVRFATYFSFSRELWLLRSSLFPRSSFFFVVVFSGCSIATALCLSLCLLPTWLPVLPI